MFAVPGVGCLKQTHNWVSRDFLCKVKYFFSPLLKNNGKFPPMSTEMSRIRRTGRVYTNLFFFLLSKMYVSTRKKKRVPEIVVVELEVDYGEAQLVETPGVQVVELRVLDVEHVVENGVELVLERADDALERHHFLADDHDPGPDHAGEVAARARRNAPAHRTVERRVVQ